MEQPRQKVFDPMFAPRVAKQRVPSYTRRPVHYTSSKQITDIRPAMVPKATPVPIEPQVKPQSVPATQPHASPPPNQAGVKWPARLRIPNRQTAVLYGMAGFVFLVGLVVSLNGLRANHQVAAQVKHGQQQTNDTVADNVVPSTTKPSPAAVKNYAVSPNLPRYLDVPKLGVHTRVLSEGVTRSGQLQVPWNIYDTGWYNASSQPGQNGAMLIDGHSGIGNMHGVFYKLATLAPGDPIVVTRGDGQKFTYKVVKVQTVSVSSVDMSGMLVSADTSKPGLNLITCAGDRIPGTDQLNQRVLVYATM